MSENHVYHAFHHDLTTFSPQQTPPKTLKHLKIVDPQPQIKIA